MRPAVAVDHRLGDLRALGQERLDPCRRDVVAARVDDQILLAIGDVQLPVGVDAADIAGVEPAVAQHRGGGLRIAPVAQHQERATHHDLAVAGDLEFDLGQRLAHGVHLGAAGAVDADQRCGFGLAVALIDRKAQSGEEQADLGIERCAARDQRLHAAAEALAQTAADQRVAHPIDEPLPWRQRRPGAQPLAAEAQRRKEQPLAPAAGLAHLGADARLHQLEEARHGGENGRTRLADVAGELLGALGVVDFGAGGDRQELAAGVLVGMRQRQERQEHIVAAADLAQHLRAAATVVQDGTVRQHHAFGRATGPRGVDDAGEILGRECLGARQRVGVIAFAQGDGFGPRQPRRAGGSLTDGGLDADDEPHGAKALRGAAQALFELGVGGDHATGAAVVEQVAMLALAVGGVRRHGHRARGHDGEIGDQPFRPVLGGEDDALARLHAQRAQAPRQRADLGCDFAPGERLVAAGAPAPNERPFAVARGLVEEHHDQVAPAFLSHAQRPSSLVHRFARRLPPPPAPLIGQIPCQEEIE